MKNTGKECAMLYREFCEWCDTVPYLELDPRLHTHSGRIEDGGYISNGVTAKAFAAWKAARCAPAAPQPRADALDTERLDWLIGQGCHHGVVYEGVDKSFWMVWLDGHDAHKDKHQISRYHTAREAIDAARSPAAMAKLIMHCTTEDEYRAAITQCVDARKAAIAAAKENK